MARQTSNFEQVRELEPTSDILAINDWYICYPNLIPYMLTNIHNKELFNDQKTIQRGKRWKDWVKKFNDTDAYVWVNDEWGELNNPIRMHGEKWRKQFGNYFASTVCHTLAIGYNMGYKEIRCHGFEGTPDEYRYEVPYIMTMIDKVRKLGVDVMMSCDMERKMKARLKKYKVDWKNIPQVKMDYSDLTIKTLHLRYDIVSPECELINSKDLKE